MNAEIYYFTGTGNSLAVARDIAAKTGGRLTAIPSVMHQEVIKTVMDAVGVVFPVYHGSFPLMVKRFVEKLEPLDKKYIFGVCTFGDSPGLVMDYLGKLVQSRRGQLAAGFAVHMPYNYITPSFDLKDFFGSFTLREIASEKQQALLAAGRKKTESISAYVNARQTGIFETDSQVITRLADYFNLKETLGKAVWLRIAGVGEPTALSFLESRQLMDRGFHADEKCTGCGICSSVCPVKNIIMVGGNPVWRHQCEQCFACLQWCPLEAVQFGNKTSGRKRYHHPDVKLADMVIPKS